MKKLFIVLSSVFVILIAFVMEGGSIKALVGPTVIVPLGLGALFTTLFSYNLGEIASTFKDAFSEDAKINKSDDYKKGVLIVGNLATATMFWSLTVVIMAIILILSNLTTPEHLGPSLAVALLSLLYGFGLKAALFIPMENALRYKVYQTSECKYADIPHSLD